MNTLYINRYDKVTFQGVICSAPLNFPRWLSWLLALCPGPSRPPRRRSPRSWVHPEHLPGKLVSRCVVAPGQTAYLGKDPNPTPHSPAGASDHFPFSCSARPGLVRHSGFRSQPQRKGGARARRRERREVAVGTEACSHSALGPFLYFIHLFLVALGLLLLCTGFLSSCGEQLLAAVRGLFVAVCGLLCCSGVSCCGACALGPRASSCSPGLNSCGPRA